MLKNLEKPTLTKEQGQEQGAAAAGGAQLAGEFGGADLETCGEHSGHVFRQFAHQFAERAQARRAFYIKFGSGGFSPGGHFAVPGWAGPEAALAIRSRCSRRCRGNGQLLEPGLQTMLNVFVMLSVFSAYCKACLGCHGMSRAVS